MAKKMKTYRIEEGTLEQIQALKQFFSDQGFDLSDAGVIQKAVSAYMDLAAQDIKKGDDSNASAIRSRTDGTDLHD